LSLLDKVLDVNVDDMTVTVQSGARVEGVIEEVRVGDLCKRSRRDQ